VLVGVGVEVMEGVLVVVVVGATEVVLSMLVVGSGVSRPPVTE
jgi:hypothetical protein